MQKTAWSEATFSVKRDGTDPDTVTVKGRVRWAPESRIEAEPRGCILILSPAHLWVATVFKPRRAGVAVETLTELHAGAFAGTYASYLLRDLMERVA